MTLSPANTNSRGLLPMADRAPGANLPASGATSSTAERVKSGKARSLRLVIGSLRAGGETALQRVSNADAGATPIRDDRPACSELYSPWTVSKARYW